MTQAVGRENDWICSDLVPIFKIAYHAHFYLLHICSGDETFSQTLIKYQESQTTFGIAVISCHLLSFEVISDLFFLLFHSVCNLKTYIKTILNYKSRETKKQEKTASS